MINPGTSINFDAHGLEEQAEAELEKEDQKCQQEVSQFCSSSHFGWNLLSCKTLFLQNAIRQSLAMDCICY